MKKDRNHGFYVQCPYQEYCVWDGAGQLNDSPVREVISDQRKGDQADEPPKIIAQGHEGSETCTH